MACVWSPSAGIMGAVNSGEPKDAHFDPEAARKRWQRLDGETLRKIIKAARRGTPIPEGQADAVALGWAWIVLGPPWERRRNRWHHYALTVLGNFGDRSGPWRCLEGDAQYDLVPMVRSTARVVERVYTQARRPAAPYREPQPGENLPEWLRRPLWGPRPHDSDPDQWTD